MAIQNSFLLDEVRCGFLIPSAIKQAWAAELEVLMEIDRVCKKHNIQYFADWGTLLGAVRHGGFIPWDDDLDIVMKREDYQKFMTVARFDLEEGFDVQTFRNQKDFWLFMGKVVGKNRFCFEKDHLRRFHNFPYIACVDIFVLDYVYRDPKKEEQRRILCKYMLGVADAIVEGSLSGADRERNLCTIEEMWGRKIQRIPDVEEMGRYLYGEVEKIFAEVPEAEADTLTQMFPWGLKGNTFHFPKEYYEEPIYLPFECTTIPVPKLYDKMLRQRYGDYMKLVKNAGAHNYPFFEGQKQNLQKVLDFKLPEFTFDRKKLHRSEEEIACKNMSYKAMAKECSEALWRMNGQLEKAMSVELLQMSQQLAMDLGTLLEQMIGEGSVIVGLLEQYCEVLYGLYQMYAGESVSGEMSAFGDVSLESPTDSKGNALCNMLGELQGQITAELEQNILQRRTVLFLPVLAKDWNGLQSLWQAAAKDPNSDVYVMPLAYYYKDYNGAAKTVCCEAENFPEEVYPQDYRLITAEYLELLHPEVIIIQNPYDAWNPAISVPELFYAQNLRKYTDKLIYVPPFAVEEYAGGTSREYSNMKYYVTMPGVVYADQIFVQSENMKQHYIDKLTEFAGEETREIWEQRLEACGLPIQDRECQTMGGAKKKILYGIGRGTWLENPEAAQQKLERNLELFESYKEQIEVEIRHFPEEEVIFSQQYDAYYGDPMPVVVEFMQAGKPVMIQNVEL